MHTLVPSLQHLACSRLIASIFNHLEVQKNFRRERFETIRGQIKEAIPHLTPWAHFQEKLEVFIDPLLQETQDCLEFFSGTQFMYESVSCVVRENMPQCWLSDGTIDHTKLARFIVLKKDLLPVNRFIFACTFCFLNDALDLWNFLPKLHKVYLRVNGPPIVKLWTEWLESNSEKDWESFSAWSLGTPLWYSNVFIMKRVLQPLNPEERSRYLLKALSQKEFRDVEMRFCMSVMTKDVQDQMFRESTVQVFSCMLSWPLRPIFSDLAENLRPYLTELTFCKVLHMFYEKILAAKKQNELIIILKNFWAQSPQHFHNATKNNPMLSFIVKDFCKSRGAY